MTSKKITIHDVAQHAKVSVSTVSLVLGGKGRISQSTIKRVYSTIEKLGYSPNRQAAMLRGGQSNVIGVIINDITDRFYAEVVAGISEVLEVNNKVLFLAQSGKNGGQLEQCFNSLTQYGIDGVIIGGGKNNISSLKDCASLLNLPLVCAAHSSHFDGFDIIRPDNMQAAKLATENLIDHGHYNMAYLGGRIDSLTRAERLGGFCATLIKYGLPFREEWIVDCEPLQSVAANAIESLLKQFPKISAVICDNTAVTLGAYFGVLRTGRSIGTAAVDMYYDKQVSLTGFDDGSSVAFSDSPLFFVSNSAKEVGRNAAERILQRLINPDLVPQQIILPPLLIK